MKKENNSLCDLYEEYYNATYVNGLREIPEPRNVYKDIINDIPNDPYGDNENVPDMVICAKVILKGTFSENIDISTS